MATRGGWPCWPRRLRSRPLSSTRSVGHVGGGTLRAGGTTARAAGMAAIGTGRAISALADLFADPVLFGIAKSGNPIAPYTVWSSCMGRCHRAADTTRGCLWCRASPCPSHRSTQFSWPTSAGSIRSAHGRRHRAAQDEGRDRQPRVPPARCRTKVQQREAGFARAACRQRQP